MRWTATNGRTQGPSPVLLNSPVRRSKAHVYLALPGNAAAAAHYASCLDLSGWQVAKLMKIMTVVLIYTATHSMYGILHSESWNPSEATKRQGCAGQNRPAQYEVYLNAF